MPGETGRAGFARSAATVTATAIPDFPKLPEFLRRQARSDQDKKDLEQYEAEIMEYFKKDSIRQGL